MLTHAEVIAALAAALQERGLEISAAAVEIGVTIQSLSRHLAGGYVRSDSLAKYRRWLSGEPVLQGRTSAGQQTVLAGFGGVAQTVPQGKPWAVDASRAEEQARNVSRVTEVSPTDESFRVVETFSGCGGLSLGFDLFNDGRTFRTVLAMDIEKAMVESYNWNRSQTDDNQAKKVCRQTDLSEFINEAEVLAFYLDHLVTQERDVELQELLDRTPGEPLDAFKARVLRIDADFLRRLREIYASSGFRVEQRRMPHSARGQTSVTGFFEALRLPPAPGRWEALNPLVWSNDEASDVDIADAEGVHEVGLAADQFIDEANALWEEAERSLTGKAGKRGARGQLATSADRIGGFVEFLRSMPMREAKALWTNWYASRKSTRTNYFSDTSRHAHMLAAYHAGRSVAVVLGGPPCQGFSRIGRGKIRSLLETGVQVHEDAGSGDARNRLLEKYVLFVAALRPQLFVFENVRHFSSSVKTPEGSFLATEVLASAINELSRDDLHYRVSSRILAANELGVPQKRERFFMVGVREDVARTAEAHGVTPNSILDPESVSEVPLSEALEGLPEPFTCGPGATSPMAQSCRTAGEYGTGSEYRAWISALPPSGWQPKGEAGSCDAHCVRPARRDDAAFFRLMGPGTRWMDYRCDDSKTLTHLREAVAGCIDELSNTSHPADRDRTSGLLDLLQGLQGRLNGSLSLRLLLECIEPLNGEVEHHLLGENYLAKRDGQHGDWVARLPADVPSKTVVSHMGKDTYGFVHPWRARTVSVREAARLQSFPDWFSFGNLGLVDAFRVIGNAVPPLLSFRLASRVAQALWLQGHGGQGANGHKNVATPETSAELFEDVVPAARRSTSRNELSAA